MKNIDETDMEYVAILAKLELSEEEKVQAKEDMEKMLNYVGKLSELDTDGVEPLLHIFPVSNVFREDVLGVVNNGNDGDNTGDDVIPDIIKNAPSWKDGALMVPKTVE